MPDPAWWEGASPPAAPRPRPSKAPPKTNAERQRAWRDRHRPVPPPLPPPPKITVAAWARRALVVPAGHPLAGRRWRIQRWQEAVLRDACDPAVKETALIVARKNGKSALVAVLVLAHLVGPLRRPGWRCGILSLNREKAGELLTQISDIAAASGLAGVSSRRTPYPGSVRGPEGLVEVQSADRGAGHASGFDLVVIDEIGLLQERHRPLLAGMRSSVSARNGRFVSLSIHGDGPFVGELIERRGEKGFRLHHYAAREDDVAVDDPGVWKAANPGLGSIKSEAYMRRESRRVISQPADQPAFIAHDLNRPQELAGEMLLALSEWQEAVKRPYPERAGECVIGLDLGESKSMSCAVAVWESGRMETFSAFPSEPSLDLRAKADGAGGVYVRAAACGALWLLGSGRTYRLAEFVGRVAEELSGEAVVGIGGDRARRAELEDALAGCWEHVEVTPVGSSLEVATAARAFRRGIHDGDLRPGPSAMVLGWSLSQALVRRDEQGLPRVVRSDVRKRIDAAVAACAAAALWDKELRGRAAEAPPPGWSW